jgi:hypothetical protein
MLLASIISVLKEESASDPAPNAGVDGDPHFKTWRGPVMTFTGV